MRRKWHRFMHIACISLFSISIEFLAMPRLAQADETLIVRDFVLSHDIHEREPVNTTYSFLPSDDRAYAFLRANNLGAPTSVSFVWHYEDQVHAVVDLAVGTSPGWRTWSSTNLRPGQWRVELVSDEGLVLAEHSFVVAQSFNESAKGSADAIEESGSAMNPDSMPFVRPAPTSSQAASGDLGG